MQKVGCRLRSMDVQLLRILEEISAGPSGQHERIPQGYRTASEGSDPATRRGSNHARGGITHGPLPPHRSTVPGLGLARFRPMR